MKVLISATVLAGLLGSPVVAADSTLDLRSNLGYDSNVFHLNGSVGARGGMFTLLDGEWGGERGWPSGWTAGLDLGAEARLYESSVSEGDEWNYFIRLRGDSHEKRSEHGFMWALRYRVQDSTFVSHFTGGVATSGTTEIGDRFDSATADLHGKWLLPGGAYGRLSFEGHGESRNYRRDYAALLLDRLDYDEVGLQPEYEVGERESKLKLNTTLVLRRYRDRRIEDAAGNPVAGTDLEYRYYGAGMAYKQALSAAAGIELKAGYEQRRDNGVGFGDRTRWNVAVGWQHRPREGAKVSLDAEWSSRRLDNQQSTVITNETPGKDGYTLEAAFVMPFPGVPAKDFVLLGQAQWESFDNSKDVRFSYDRLETLVGVRKEF